MWLLCLGGATHPTPASFLRFEREKEYHQAARLTISGVWKLVLEGFSQNADGRPMNPIFADIGTSVFEVMSGLARERDAINLGQGFPDDPGPPDVRAKAAEAVLSGWNQYPPMMGLPELREAIAAHYRRFHGLELDPATEVMVTSGATEALAGALLALLQPGDEVVLFQPMYDAYLPLVQRAGGIAKFVTLKPPLWTIEEADLAAVFSPRTRVVLFNKPLNPTGVVYDRQALALLARFCVKYDAIALCDEVWEHVIFDGLTHVPLMAIEGMRERTVKIGSAGKIFSLTGWKVGLVCAAPAIMRVIARAHQFITFTTPPNLQSAVAYGLAKQDSYFTDMRAAFQRSRDRFSAGLVERGFDVLPSAGTYFVNIDIGALGRGDDVAFCRWLVEEHGVAAIPVSAFYTQTAIRTVVRFCFAKRDATLDAALARLDRVAPLSQSVRRQRPRDIERTS
jgi:N-succinyldiaminopimelate aminotransferase